MLPFLDKNRMTTAIMAGRGKSDIAVNPEVEAPDSDMDPGLKEAAADIMRALDKKSVMDLASALKAAFEICESSESEPEENEEA